MRQKHDRGKQLVIPHGSGLGVQRDLRNPCSQLPNFGDRDCGGSGIRYLAHRRDRRPSASKRIAARRGQQRPGDVDRKTGGIGREPGGCNRRIPAEIEHPADPAAHQRIRVNEAEVNV
ncbi:MAG TPA: hypothetical protein VHX87_09860 [Galbitalea sp.]|nr:hypothetical protein [Galbitalea sp.]